MRLSVVWKALLNPLLGCKTCHSFSGAPKTIDCRFLVALSKLSLWCCPILDVTVWTKGLGFRRSYKIRAEREPIQNVTGKTA
jgi:hypothetical protein